MDNIGSCLIISIIVLSLFFGIFFGVNYSEVERSEYIPAICQCLSATIVPRYCCHLDCKCVNATLGLPKCQLLMLLSEPLSPIECSQNSTLCPNSGSDAYCDGGNYCCSECCHCGNCYCCKSIDHGRCQYICDQCYSVELNVTYHVGQQPQNATYTQDFSKSLEDAEVFLATHMPNSTFWCYYNPSSVTEIILNREFTQWKWILIAFPIFFLYAWLFALTNLALRAYIEDQMWRWSVVSIIWNGIIVSLVILLQVWQYGLVPMTGLIVLMVFILLFVTFGSLPFVIKVLIAGGSSLLQAIGLSFMGLIIPLVVYVPIILYVPSSRKILLIILGIQLALVLSTIICIRMKVLVLNQIMTL